MIISIDADLQDDPTKIKEMVDLYLEGYDMILGVKKNRKSNFKSLKFDQTKYLDEPENDFYNNNYYKSKKEFLLKVKN